MITRPDVYLLLGKDLGSVYTPTQLTSHIYSVQISHDSHVVAVASTRV